MINECILNIDNTNSEATEEKVLLGKIKVYIPKTKRKNNYPIGLFPSRKISNAPIPKNFTKIFTTYNIFDFKDANSSVSSDTYYKANAHVCLLIASQSKRSQCTRQDVSLTFVSLYCPKKLFSHLTEDCKLEINKISPGVYHIYGEMYATQILVKNRLSSNEQDYLYNIYSSLNFEKPEKHLEQTAETSFNTADKSSIPIRSTMFTESLLNICGTSTQEIVEQARKESAEFYLSQINKLEEELKQLSDEEAFLKSRLALHESNKSLPQ